MEIKTAIIIFIILILTFSIMIINQKDNKENLSVESLMSEINSLKQDIKRLNNKNIELGVEGITPELRGALEEMVDERMTEKIMDSIWNEFFYYFTNFDSMEGSTGSDTFDTSGQANVTLDGWEVAVEASVTASSYMQKVQIPTLGGSSVGLNRNLSWRRKQRMRANVSYYDTTNSSSPEFTGYIVRGSVPLDSYDHPFFGFKIIDGTLYGVSQDNSTDGESTVELMNLSSATSYVLEAVYLPREKIVFKVMDNTTLKMVEKGTLKYGSDNLPSPINTNTETFYGMQIERTNNHTVQMLGSYFEYMQRNKGFNQ